jgi:hypothetical protein
VAGLRLEWLRACQERADFQAIEEATRAPVDERLKALKKKNLAAEAVLTDGKYIRFTDAQVERI